MKKRKWETERLWKTLIYKYKTAVTRKFSAIKQVFIYVNDYTLKSNIRLWKTNNNLEIIHHKNNMTMRES